jgi:hypothetical protein
LAAGKINGPTATIFCLGVIIDGENQQEFSFEARLSKLLCPYILSYNFRVFCL